MAYRSLSSQEQQDVIDYFFNLGIGTQEVEARLALLKSVAKREKRPVFEIISEMKLARDHSPS